MSTGKDASRGARLATPTTVFRFQHLLFTDDTKRGTAFELASHVLNGFEQSQSGDRFADASGAKEKLAEAILEHYPKFLETLPTEDDGFFEVRDGILEIDARFADYIEKHFGSYGLSAANSIRTSEETIQVASDSVPAREWARKWQEFSQTDSGKEVAEKTEFYAKTIFDAYDAYPQNAGEVDKFDAPGFRDWIKSSFAESIKKDLLPLFEERERFTGPLDGLRTDLFQLWLGSGGGGRIANITSKRNCQFASVVWLHIVRPGIEKEWRAPVRIASPTTLALSQRNIAINVNSDLIAVEVEGGFQLSLDGIDAPTGSLAQFLNDEVFHTYIVTQMKFVQNGMPENGEFFLDAGWGTILNAKGYNQHERIKRVGGKTIVIREHNSKNIATVKRHIEDLGKIYVNRVGDFSTSAKKMPLVYDIKDGRHKERSLRHHPLVVAHFRSEIGSPERSRKDRERPNFVQVPRGLIEQPNASAVRYGYAFIQAVRDGSYHSVRKNEPITIKLRAAAGLVGKENKGKISEKAFFTGIADRYIEAAEVGDLGRVEVDMTSERLILRPEAHIIEPYIQKIPKPRNRKK